MQVPQSIPGFTPRQQAPIMAIGFLTVISVGVVACIALVLGAIWLLVSLLLVAVQAITETLSAIGTTYATADPLIKFLLLLTLSVVVYSVHKSTRKGARP